MNKIGQKGLAFIGIFLVFVESFVKKTISIYMAVR